MIEFGQYNERSIGWASFHPFEGFAYLWEVSLLGANTPAAVGMNPIIFKKEEETKLMQQLAIDLANEGLTAEAIEQKLMWEKTEEYIRYRVRNASRFIDASLRTIVLDEDEGIMSVVGKLKPDYIPEGGKADSMVMQNVMFPLKKGWTLAKAKAWIGARELTALNVIINSVVPFQDLALADEDTALDNDAAESRRREYAGGEDNIDWAKYLKAFLWYDSENKETFGGYKLPIADVIDGDLKAVPKGIFAAAGAISGARGGVDIPEDDIESIKKHLEKYYAKMDRESPWEEAAKKDSQKGMDITALKLTTLNTSEGGTVMPEGTTETIVVVEAGSSADLAKKNATIRAETELQEAETQAKLIRENVELRKTCDAARLEAINSEVRTMQAEGYIVKAQVDAGLVDALASIPDEAEVLVGDKKVKARDVIIGTLKFGGKLKLKHEIAKDVLPDDTNDDLAKAEAHGVKTDVERRRRQLMQDNPKMKYAEALDRATREVRK
jgi:hypothetical protein